MRLTGSFSQICPERKKLIPRKQKKLMSQVVVTRFLFFLEHAFCIKVDFEERKLYNSFIEVIRKESNLAVIHQLIVCKSPDILIRDNKDVGRLKNNDEVIFCVAENASNSQIK